ncbi:hypothetical protein H9L12_00425 [Sphingomonas rhizophila]|uniref:Uncharacterized protein n=1 Tax=Sphingomonas rhizophila TaxID=2071607 RepID=A0A7G9SBD8_9SPHN|nr:hypothetical protein [Sphingomonas rhizophila]QNN65163.1 hypothetical protein H9L12_00425 [Sphingomonas rhizophila]
MDLNFIYREHCIARIGAANAPSEQARAVHQRIADRLFGLIERAKLDGTIGLAS